MSSGVRHAQASVVISFPTGIGQAILHGPALGFTCWLGCLSGIVLSPDLDVDGRTHSESVIYQLPLGCLIGTIFTVFWYPYARIFKHRSVWSHLPILGTLIRVLYLFIPLIIASLLFGFWPGLVDRLFMNPLFWSWCAGLAVSDALHWVMDRWGDTDG